MATEITHARKALYVRLERPLHRRAKMFAARRDMAMEDLGRRAVVEYLDREEAKEAEEARKAGRKASA